MEPGIYIDSFGDIAIKYPDGHWSIYIDTLLLDKYMSFNTGYPDEFNKHWTLIEALPNE